jgi:hypothetical protein
MAKETIKALLYSDNRPESLEARELLINSGIPFREFENTWEKHHSNNPVKPPALFSREGDFNGLSQIEEFIEIVKNRPNL